MNKYSEKMTELNCYYLQDGPSKHLSESDLLKVEEIIGSSLPDDYREFLTDFGCFALDAYARFGFKDSFPKSEHGIVGVFYGLEEGDAYDLLSNFETYKGRIHSSALPIALDPSGNQVCLILDGHERGKVYFWYHATELSGMSSLFLLADSFDEFVNSLRFEPA